MEPINDDLLIRYLLRETNATEDASVSAWLKSDPSHEKRYAALSWVWEESKRIPEKEIPDTEMAWERFKAKREAPKALPLQVGMGWTSTWVKMAASIVLLVTFTWIGTLFLPHGGRAYFTEVSLVSGDTVRTERLLDGSTIILNKNTTLSYFQPLFSNQRLVQFRSGEAFFEVAHDGERPFVVEAAEFSVRVLGTSFHVKAGTITQKVILEKGSVAIASAASTITLSPGEMAILDQKTQTIQKSGLSNTLYRYYVSNQFVADSLPLAELVQALSEAYGVVISIRSSVLQSTPISTTLSYGSLEENLTVIQETLQVRISKEGEQIVIY